jgi:hypothetical protein
MSFGILRLVLAAAVAVLTSTAPVFGATTTYATAADFDAAVNIQTTETFEGAALGSYGAGGLIIGELQFIGHNGFGGFELNIVSPATSVWHDWGSGKMLKGPDPIVGRDRRIYMDFSRVPGGGILAFGFNLMVYGSAAGTTQIRLSNGETLAGTLSTPYPTQVFWGVSSDTPIVYAELLSTTSSGYPMIDNFVYGNLAAATPPDPPAGAETAEVMTLVYIGSGLLGMRALARRRQLKGTQVA